MKWRKNELRVRNEELSAADLINKAMELKILTGNGKWGDELKADNLPRYYRYRQIRALCGFYGIENPVNLFSHAARIETEDDVEKINEYLVNFFDSYGPPHRDELVGHKFQNVFSAYRILIEMRIQLEETLGMPDILGGAPLVKNLEAYREKILGEILRARDEITSILAFMISPDNKRVDIKTLVRDYQYPDVNLEEVDAEYI